MSNQGRNAKREGARSHELYVLQALNRIKNAVDGIVPPGGMATEATLVSVLNAIIASDQDIEILLVRDTGNGDLVVQQITNYETGTPVVSYKDVNGNPYVPVGPLEYLDPSAVMNLVLTELLDQGVSLDNIEAYQLIISNAMDVTLSTRASEATLQAVEALLTTISTLDFATETTLSLLEGKDFATETTLATRATEATLQNVEALLTSILADTSNLDAPLSGLATELTLATLAGTDFATQTTLAALEVLLTTISGDTAGISNLATEATLGDVKTNTDNLDAALTTLFNTLGQKASAASAPVVLSTEQEVILDAIKTAVENIDSDLGTGGLATETTLQGILTLLGLVKTDTLSIVTNTSGSAKESTLQTIDAVLDAIKLDTAAMVVDMAAIEVLLTSLDGKDFARETTLLTLATETTLQATNTKLDTIDTVLDGIRTDTAAMVIDLAAIEVLMTSLETKDFATETTLATLATEATLLTIDSVLDSIKVDTAAMVVDLAGIEALLTTIDADTSSLATNVDVALSTRASEATVSAINTKLTPASRTHNTVNTSGSGSVPSGSIRGSVLNVGSSAGTWNGITIPAGVSISWGVVGQRDTYGAIAYDATTGGGTTFIIEYTT